MGRFWGVKRGSGLHFPIDQIDQQKYENLHPEYPEISSIVVVVCLYIVFFVFACLIFPSYWDLFYTQIFGDTIIWIAGQRRYGTMMGVKKFLFLLYFRLKFTH